MNRYDVDAETLVVREAIATGQTASQFGSSLGAGSLPGSSGAVQPTGTSDPVPSVPAPDPMDFMRQLLAQAQAGQGKPSPRTVQDPTLFSAGNSDEGYLQAGMELFGDQGGV